MLLTGNTPPSSHLWRPRGTGQHRPLQSAPALRPAPCPQALHSQAAGDAGALLHRGHDGVGEAIGSEASALGLGSLGTRADSEQDLAKGPHPGRPSLPKPSCEPLGDEPAQKALTQRTGAGLSPGLHRSSHPTPCRSVLKTQNPTGQPPGPCLNLPSGSAAAQHRARSPRSTAACPHPPRHSAAFACS